MVVVGVIAAVVVVVVVVVAVMVMVFELVGRVGHVAYGYECQVVGCWLRESEHIILDASHLYLIALNFKLFI